MILTHLLRFLQGCDTIACAPVEGDTAGLHGAVLQAIADAEILPLAVRHLADGTLLLLVTRRDTVRLARLPIAAHLTLWERRGLPELVLRYRRRIGIPIGAVLFCLVLFYFSRILWRVEVTGDCSLPAERIEASLAALGCEAGAWLPGMDLYAMSDKLLVAESSLAYASVVRKGTVLLVHVREKEVPPPQTSRPPANLVAEKDGVVVSFAIKEGQSMVSAGQAVRAGELLVSGVVLHRGGSLSVVSAEGTVLARTTCTATVEVQLSEEVREEAGRVILDRGIKIFGWDINFFKTTRNEDKECDTITENKQMALAGGVRVPIWQAVTYVPAYRTRTVVHTPAEAVRIATSRAQAQARAEMGDAEVLSTTTVVEQTADGYRVTYTVECIMDITACREIGTWQGEGS